ncbi:tRNA (uridine(54)-C5)-methyltransferase TrmA [Thiosulfativibrio zosterae]|uniref:tRNA/tmRNA (uracil-C(5))-methyltransferase n=1 Tax=Thiosulfativibrio zosterae TaxID=2675053 RepID=A0A6F8PQG9_9GAMM|nr:tRNA (uridine(54)-C5)-methyltransferase TrmA [Thiosulfativibrio zosterae]BBP44284.1 tRNA/tmRNA (uracil-C(5))-methyltransferase [Thiosulfativibrio zosterae]
MLCQVNPDAYSFQLEEKAQRLKRLVPSLSCFNVFESEPAHYRARTEFSIWHEGDLADYIMFDTDTKQRVVIKDCPMVLQSINDLMPKLMAEIMADPVLKLKLFEVDFLATLSGEMMVSLIYRKSLQKDPEFNQAWLNSAQELKEKLNITQLIGRARKEKICLDSDFVVERLQVDGKAFVYQQIENSFTQPNAGVAQKMLSWARQMAFNISADTPKRDLIELYCGNGHFSIALAECFNRVLATEISKTSVASAQWNIEANQISNLTVLKMAAEDVSAALQGESYNRLKDIDLASYDFGTIFVDPPRSGLDDLTRKMVCEFDHIIYISCNPDTLAFDLQSIQQTHELVASALFDQFPYTHHIESGVYLRRKTL